MTVSVHDFDAFDAFDVDHFSVADLDRDRRDKKREENRAVRAAARRVLDHSAQEERVRPMEDRMVRRASDPYRASHSHRGRAHGVPYNPRLGSAAQSSLHASPQREQSSLEALSPREQLALHLGRMTTASSSSSRQSSPRASSCLPSRSSSSTSSPAGTPLGTTPDESFFTGVMEQRRGRGSGDYGVLPRKHSSGRRRGGTGETPRLERSESSGRRRRKKSRSRRGAGAFIPEQPLLFESIAKGDTEKVKQLVAENRTLLQMRYNESLPIHEAAKRLDSDLIDFFIQNGARVDVADRQGFLPLHWVMRCGPVNVGAAVESARKLLGRKADPLQETGEVPPPIFDAFDSGAIGLVEIFIGRGIEWMGVMRSLFERPAAFESRHLALIQYLVDTGEIDGGGLFSLALQIVWKETNLKAMKALATNFMPEASVMPPSLLASLAQDKEPNSLACKLAFLGGFPAQYKWLIERLLQMGPITAKMEYLGLLNHLVHKRPADITLDLSVMEDDKDPSSIECKRAVLKGCGLIGEGAECETLCHKVLRQQDHMGLARLCREDVDWQGPLFDLIREGFPHTDIQERLFETLIMAGKVKPSVLIHRLLEQPFRPSVDEKRNVEKVLVFLLEQIKSDEEVIAVAERLALDSDDASLNCKLKTLAECPERYKRFVEQLLTKRERRVVTTAWSSQGIYYRLLDRMLAARPSKMKLDLSKVAEVGDRDAYAAKEALLNKYGYRIPKG